MSALEAGVAPWQCDWLRTGLPLRSNGEAYKGVNVLLLGLSIADQGFTNPHWVTFRQAQELGGNIRKGARGTPVIFYKPLVKQADDGDARADARNSAHLRGSGPPAFLPPM